MSLIIGCSKCAKKYKVGDDKAGKKIKCSGCGTIIPIPAPAVEDSAEEEVDLWDLPPAEDSSGLPPPALPRKTFSGQTSSTSSRSRSEGGMPGWLKTTLMVLAGIGGITLLGCGGCILILRNLDTSGSSSISASAREAYDPVDPARANVAAANIVWTKYTNKKSGFEVDFPTQEVVERQEDDEKHYLSSLAGTEAGLKVTAVPTGKTFSSNNANLKYLKGVRDDSIRSLKADLISTREISIGEHPAIQFEFAKVVDGSLRIFTARLVTANQYFYQVRVSRARNDSIAKETERFLNSFRIVGP